MITTVERVLAALYLMSGQTDQRRTESAVGFSAGRLALQQNAADLLGPTRPNRPTRIMVTMPTEAADDYGLVRALLERGMDCVRINCAHDDEDRWERMVEKVHTATGELGRRCRILMDLPGPKLRTGTLQPGPRVVRLRPRRDDLGRPTEPVLARLMAEDGPADGRRVGSEPSIPVPRKWLAGLQRGDRIRLRDTRGSRRTFDVVDADGPGVVVAVDDTTYLATGTKLRGRPGRAEVGALPAVEHGLLLRVGDHLRLTSDLLQDSEPASTESGADDGRGDGVPRIGCTLPEALAALELGHRVLFDDGKIAGVVVAVGDRCADIRITATGAKGSKLRAEKGINMPDSELRLPAFGPEDGSILPFVVRHADLVGLSFAQSPEDVDALQTRLRALDGERLGIVLKIETQRGFAALPETLLAAMRSPRLGVMVARGDLAVECGFERLAEVQEEMLCLCASAHLPVIWATQVLDQMAKTGQPSRAEISDAAMAGRSECVVLNKGPHIVEAVAALDDILRRMASHQRKKDALLRRLQTWAPETV